MRRLVIATALVAAPLVGCGKDAAPQPATGRDDGVAHENGAVEAREGNVVHVAGVRYRVVVFRQLNPRARPDDAVYDGPPPADGRGLFGVFLQACNTSRLRQQLTDDIALRNAFGEGYPRVEPAAGNSFAYTPETLEPGRCLPADDSAAERALPGAAIVYAVPFDDLVERPFVLEIAGERGSRPRAVELDL